MMNNHSTNNFPYRLAAIDIDDTLVGPDKRISPENAAAVRRLIDAGCRVVLASGRRHDNMLPFHAQLHLDTPLVSCHGALAKTPAGDILHHALIRSADAAAVVADGLALDLTVMHWSTHNGIRAHARTPLVDRYATDCADPVPVSDLRQLAHEPAEKITWGARSETINSLLFEMRRRYRDKLTVLITDDWFLEFMHPHATKAAGVAAVAKSMNIESHEVLAFGDGNNDAPMLAWAGLGIAMPHARPSALRAANLTAPEGHPESALARAIAMVFDHARRAEPAPLQFPSPLYSGERAG